MYCDYYALQQKKLTGKLDALEQAAVAYKEAKGEQKKQAEDKLKEAARQVVGIEPHLACMWHSAQKKEVEKRQDSEAENAVREAWQEKFPFTTKPVPVAFEFIPDVENLEKFSCLPPLSFALKISFRLEKPYISRDDVDFYLLDNPLRKEKIFKVPMAAASSWKGALRSAMTQQLVADFQKSNDEAAFMYKRAQLFRLFGSEKENVAAYLNRILALQHVGPPPRDDEKVNQEEKKKWTECFQDECQKVGEEFNSYLDRQGCRINDAEGFKGCTYFFPTFFDKIGLEVINPHLRHSGAGTQPIYLECAPRDSEGIFTLLYVPFDTGSRDEDEQRRRAAEDLKALAEGIYTMFRVYGFGAKTSSGFGTAKDKLPHKGLLLLRAVLPEKAGQKGASVAKLSFFSLSELRDVARCVAGELRKGVDV